MTADLGDVTILVNNAGILTLSSVDNPPAPEVQRMINVNLTATIFVSLTYFFLLKNKNFKLIISHFHRPLKYFYPK